MLPLNVNFITFFMKKTLLTTVGSLSLNTTRLDIVKPKRFHA